MIASAALRDAAARLAQAGIDNPGFEARLLLLHALGLPRTALPDRNATIDAAAFNHLVARRAAREPLALITGRQGFWTLELEVSPVTLIPRADSETLIEAALAEFPNRPEVRHILDLGTGTGCLLLAALSEFPDAWGVGMDLVPEAAMLAARNAISCGLAGRAAMVCGNWDAALQARFDLILSNPPYIDSGDLAGLMPEVAKYEPITALDGGWDGLTAYRYLIPNLSRLLTPGGAAILELGIGQAESATALARAHGFPTPVLRQDLGGVARALVLRRAAP